MEMKEFMNFEADSDIIKYQSEYKNIMLWPYIRTVLMRKIEEQEWDAIAVLQKKNQSHYWKDYIQYNTFRLPKSDILFMTQSNSLIEEEGGLKSRLDGDYIEISGKSVADCLRHVTDFDYEKYRHVSYCTNDFIQRLIFSEGKRNALSKKDENTIDEMINCLRKEFPCKLEEGIYAMLRKNLKAIITRFPAYYKYYSRLMDIIQPKVVFYNCATYGSPEIRVMNDCGVLTAEFQHGYICPNSLAYCHSQKLAENKEYRKHMPQYLLTFHDYWTRNIHIPSIIYRVGNPIFEKNIHIDTKSINDISESNILVLPDFLPKDYEGFIRDLLRCFPKEYIITIKIHPNSPGDVEVFQNMFDSSRIVVAINGSVYDYIRKARYVVGDCSTAMYEAAALGKSVFVIDKKISHMYTSKDFGVWVKNADEMYQYIQEHTDLNKEKNIYFDLNWRENYHAFLKDVVGLTIE